MNWINLAQNRDRWQPRVNTVGLFIRYINQHKMNWGKYNKTQIITHINPLKTNGRLLYLTL